MQRLMRVGRVAGWLSASAGVHADEALRNQASQLLRRLQTPVITAKDAFLDSLTGKVPENYAPPGPRPE